jgi:hypothetical protein
VPGGASVGGSSIVTVPGSWREYGPSALLPHNHASSAATRTSRTARAKQKPTAVAWAIWSGSNSGSCVGIFMSPVYTRPGVASSTSSHSARGLEVDYDLSFASHPRSPSR